MGIHDSAHDTHFMLPGLCCKSIKCKMTGCPENQAGLLKGSHRLCRIKYLRMQGCHRCRAIGVACVVYFCAPALSCIQESDTCTFDKRNEYLVS